MAILYLEDEFPFEGTGSLSVAMATWEGGRVVFGSGDHPWQKAPTRGNADFWGVRLNPCILGNFHKILLPPTQKKKEEEAMENL